MHPVTHEDIKRARRLSARYFVKCRRYHEFDDLFSAALLGLTLAARAYKPQVMRGVDTWERYSFIRMKYAIIRYFHFTNEVEKRIRKDALERPKEGMEGFLVAEFPFPDVYLRQAVERLSEHQRLSLMAYLTVGSENARFLLPRQVSRQAVDCAARRAIKNLKKELVGE